jgi:gamma-glutamylcyclotransferase (GGCT)/AIG2-like uncharacterized protein YtfP
VDRGRLDLVVGQLDRLSGEPGGGAVEDWVHLWRLAVPDGAGTAPPPPTPEACAAAVEAALDRPSHRLAAYGTLRPGQPNHGLVAGLGPWEPAVVRGRLGDWEGYPILRAGVPGSAPVPVMVLTSTRLADLWAELDAFEGPAYRCSWVVAEWIARPGVVAARCYVDADQSPR